MITMEQDLRIEVDGSQPIYVGESSRAAIREDARGAFDQRLRAALALWEDLDLKDLDAVKQVQFEVVCAAQAIDAIKYLAPIPDEVLGDG